MTGKPGIGHDLGRHLAAEVGAGHETGSPILPSEWIEQPGRVADVVVARIDPPEPVDVQRLPPLAGKRVAAVEGGELEAASQHVAHRRQHPGVRDAALEDLPLVQQVAQPDDPGLPVPLAPRVLPLQSFQLLDTAREGLDLGRSQQAGKHEIAVLAEVLFFMLGKGVVTHP